MGVQIPSGGPQKRHQKVSFLLAKKIKKSLKKVLTFGFLCGIIYKHSTREQNKNKFAGVAQLVEQLTCNQQVVGSIPITSSKCGGFPERPKGADCKSVVTDFGGSNPPSPTMKKTIALAIVFFSYIRLTASLIASQ